MQTLAPQIPYRAIYIIVVSIAFVFLIGVVWFMFNEMFTLIRGAAVNISESLSTSSETFNSADTFLTAVFTWFPILALLGLSYWVYIYSQRRTVETW